MPIADRSTPARDAAVGLEDMIRHKAIETAFLIDAGGSTFVKQVGQQGRVSFTHEQLSGAAGMTLTHNHPNGYGPSLEDVLLAAEYELRELRVVTAKHRHGVAMLRRDLLAPLTTGFPVEEAGAILAVRNDVKSGMVHPSDFGPEVRHRTWQRLASGLGFDYWRQES